MNTAVEASLARAPEMGPQDTAAAGRRIVSIDIFRGITMAVMIFVNELSGVGGMPWWTRHAPGRLDYMTYVDMVFPFFLFAVGMSLPLSVAQRLKRNPSLPALWLHIASRSIALIVLGLILANADKADPARMAMNGSAWGLLGLLGAMLYLGVYGTSEKAKAVGRILRAIGLAGVILLLAIFRRNTPSGHAGWLDFSYPEILGLIGFSYFAAAILYVPTRRRAWAPWMWFVLLMALCALSSVRWTAFPSRLPIYAWPFGNGAMCSMVMAGASVSSIFLDGGTKGGPHKATLAGAGFAALALVAGRLLTPLGVSKIRATPTWCLYSIAAATLLFTVLYWVCDVKGGRRWVAAFRPAGLNTLLTYLLPDLWYFALGSAGIAYFGTHWNTGWPGVARTAAFTVAMLGVAAALTRAKVRLQL